MKWLSRSPFFVLLLLSRMISHIGDVLFTMAVSWTVLGQTHSVVLAAIVPLVTLVPPVVLSLPLATLADRWPKKSVMVFTDWGRGVFVAGAALLLIHDVMTPLVFYGIAAALTVGGLLFSPAITAVFPDVVPPEHLTEANGLWASALSLLSIGSYALGGVLVAVLSPGWALVVDAMSFAVSGAVLALLPISQRRAAAQKGVWNFVYDSFAGIRYLWNDRYLRRFILVVAPMNAVFGPIQIFSLIFSRLVLHAGLTGYGVIEACSGLGSILAGLLVKRFAPLLTLGGWIRAAAMGSGIGIGAALLFPYLPVAMAAYFFIAGVTAMLSIPFVSAMERSAPEAERGRVLQSLFLLLGGLSMPLGLLMGSWAMDHLGVKAAFAGIAGAFGVMALVALLVDVNPPAAHVLSEEYRVGTKE